MSTIFRVSANTSVDGMGPYEEVAAFMQESDAKQLEKDLKRLHRNYVSVIITPINVFTNHNEYRRYMDGVTLKEGMGKLSKEEFAAIKDAIKKGAL